MYCVGVEPGTSRAMDEYTNHAPNRYYHQNRLTTNPHWAGVVGYDLWK
jgi:hypothetical protein